MLAESVIAEMQREGGPPTCPLTCLPTNLASIAFSRTVFPEADETYPPEDKQCASFMLSL